MRAKNSYENDLFSGGESIQMSPSSSTSKRGVVVSSDNIQFMQSMPSAIFKLIVTSPPYNL